MKKTWLNLGAKFESLSSRERVLLTLALLSLALLLAYLPLEKVLNEQRIISTELQKLQQQNQQSMTQISAFKRRLKLNPNEAYRHRLQKLTEQTQDLDAKLKYQMIDMVPADQMPKLLGHLLREVTGVKLLSFKSIAPVALLDLEQDQGGNKVNLYSHGIDLTLEGDFFSVLKFIQAVENMPDKLYWKNMDYRVENYPLATVNLTLQTMSMNKDFISVAKQN